MQPGEHILLLCHSFPPVPGIGGRRWAKFAKELAKRGYVVHVIGQRKRIGSVDSAWSGDVQHPNIRHHAFRSRYPAILEKSPLISFWDKLRYKAWLAIIPWLTKENIFDRACLSKKRIMQIADGLIKQNGIRHIVATGAPFSLMVYGVELKKRHSGIQLTTDFRDPWTWGPYYGRSTATSAQLLSEDRKEFDVIRNSDHVTSPYAEILATLQQKHDPTGKQFVLLPHALDPEDLPTAPPLERSGIFRMIYAGSLYRESEGSAYFDALVATFAAMRDHRPELAGKYRIDMYITGSETTKYRDQVNDAGLNDVMAIHEPLPNRRVLELIAQSNLVVAFLPQSKKDLLTTKFHELFCLGVPVLHVGEPGVVSRTLAKRRLGDSICVEELIAELPKFITGERQIELDPSPDLSDVLLGPVTDRLIREVLV